MNKRKLIALICLASVAVSAFLGGCSGSENKTESTATTASSAVSSQSETKASDTQNVTQVQTTTASTIETEAQTQPQNENQNQDNEPSYCTVYVEDNSYTCSVGDTITYVFNLKTPEALEDFQATTNYDSGMLELIEADSAEMFPVAGSIVICNTDLQNTIKYNAVNISGMDFTKGGALISLDFKVLDSGNTTIGTTLEYMDSVGGEPYVSDYRILGDFDYSEEII